MEEEIICPVCQGKGKLPESYTIRKIDYKKVIKKLRENGYTIREIMTHLGFHSPRAVDYWLKKDN